jgi:hypothetical protein
MSDGKERKLAYYWDEWCEQRGSLADEKDHPSYVNPDEFDYMMRGSMRGLKEHKEIEKH